MSQAPLQCANNAETAALLAKIAAQDGHFLYSIFYYNYMTHIYLAVINRLMKSQAFKPVGKPREIPRPKKITNLQHDMGLTDNKKMYSYCRVSLFLSFIVLPSFVTYNRQLFEMS